MVTYLSTADELGDEETFARLIQKTLSEFRDDGIASIGNYAFSRTNSLRSVKCPNVTSIGEYAFQFCKYLTSASFANVRSIGKGAFYGCSKLSWLYIYNVTSIGDAAFESCSELTYFHLYSTTPPTLGTSVFSNCTSLSSIYVPAESVDAYKTADGWSEYADKIKPIPQE